MQHWQSYVDLPVFTILISVWGGEDVALKALKDHLAKLCMRSMVLLYRGRINIRWLLVQAHAGLYTWDLADPRYHLHPEDHFHKCSGAIVLEKLRLYATDKGLRAHTEFNSEVIKVERHPEGGWAILQHNVIPPPPTDNASRFSAWLTIKSCKF